MIEVNRVDVASKHSGKKVYYEATLQVAMSDEEFRWIKEFALHGEGGTHCSRELCRKVLCLLERMER